MGDGMLHIGCIALFRMSERLLGYSPSENAHALLTLPIDFGRIAPGNLDAVGGEFAGIESRDLAPSARSFDHGNSPHLRIPSIDGLTERSKGNSYQFEANREFLSNLGNFMATLSEGHRKSMLGISLLGELDSPTNGVLLHEYKGEVKRLKITKPMWSDSTEMAALALRIWTYDGELCVSSPCILLVLS